MVETIKQNEQTTEPYLTDRSRHETLLTCARLRYLAYEHEGRGLARKALSVPLTVGIWTHHGLAYLLNQVAIRELKGSSYPKVQTSDEDFISWAVEVGIQEALAGYDQDVSDRGFDLDQIGDPTSPVSYVVAEQRALIEANIRLFAKVGLRELVEDYEILEVEQEIPFQLTDGILWMSRPDAILRRRRTGGIVPLEFKTTWAWNEQVQEQHRISNQGLSNLVAVERHLGEKVEAYRYIYIVKGSYTTVGSPVMGCKSYQNLLIHPYKLADVSGLDLGSEYYVDNLWKCEGPHVMGNGKKCPGPTPDKPDRKHYLDRDNLKRCSIWDEPLGIKGWMEKVPMEVLNAMVARPMAYVREEREVEDWVEQTQMSEERAAEAGLARPELDSVSQEHYRWWLNKWWPQNRQQCWQFNSRCSMFPVCHEGADLRTMADGGLVWRTAHHEPELGKFKREDEEAI